MSSAKSLPVKSPSPAEGARNVMRTVKRFLFQSFLVMTALFVGLGTSVAPSMADAGSSYAHERVVRSSTPSERSGQAILLAGAPSGGSSAERGSIMLSMETRSAKDNLTKLVIAAYVAIWSFFYFTHDAGEVSE
ncbi:hypothetical protein GUITHDRAFT_101691 [Guillardia theta CCMP2712]|uniref:Uncharacterized protein n=1 Tax=Guillardia theta (strain CCMP2712) TaxID=905079 RepID=L1JVW1_GUITC|nr:hypothetical protein GUITHDRAFT_101691 [Guillardia theta CCMP2712]EKX52522.1 hypothetical protein GUITHDRAFT_101691 [Guillardia theta CCMP2712]|eukprot:XP_005839502.1 hypothetical protein GUITHDRAFT_101691 [Guillardia theta CCMP2712]